MKTKMTVRWAGVIIVVGLMTLSLTAWNQHAGSVKVANDTIPKKGDRKVTNLDDVLEDLDRNSMDLEKELKKSFDAVHFDGDKVRAELEKALKEVDLEKLKAELNESLSKVDFDKMKLEMSKLKEVDFPKIEMELKRVDMDKLKAELNESLSKIDFEKMKSEMSRLKEIDLPKIEKEMKEIRPQVEKSLQEAKKSLEKAKTEIKEYKTFQQQLEEDGLIGKDNYTIIHNDGQLTINGKVQSAEVYNKYRAFLEKHKNFTWKKKGDDFEINNDKKD